MGTENISRRNFIRASALTGTALYLGFYFPASAKQGQIVATETPDDNGFELNAWIRIGTDGKVTLTDHRAEMGQGSYQSVP
ncbi:MAG: twin-arginine translocation signal domain-containing protein, partial [Bacteroidetes bacterium]|nr:twin-arginine translocation signal domain-containing protein [Bacteroidota bacterium]